MGPLLSKIALKEVTWLFKNPLKEVDNCISPLNLRVCSMSQSLILT
jgi:hypothetical protein